MATITAGGGLTGDVASEGATPTLAVVSANGGLVVNADNIALTVAPSADALSATTSSGSGLEILSSGLSLVQGCANNEILKWNETSDVWACGADVSGGTPTLDSVTAAIANNTAIDSNAFTVNWNWDFTTAAVDSGLNISESSASTSGTQDQQALVEITTLSGSTASPLQVTNASTDVGDIFFDLTNAGDFVVRDAGTAFASFLDTGAITFTPTAGQSFTVNNTAQGAADLVSIAPTWTADNTADALSITTTYNVSASTSTVYGLNLINADNGGSTGVIDALALFSNDQATETMADGVIIRHNASSGILTDGLQIENTTAGGTITNAINILETAGTVTTGINLGAGLTTGINANANTIVNIGNAGTDFDTSGGLALASTLTASNLGIEFTESDTNPSCAAGNFTIYADLSENKLKKCENGVASDVNAIPDVNSFTDTTTESVVDADTTDYWDGTVPNITPKSTGSEILVMMSANITGTSATDTQISARILRNTAAITCQTTGTAVGGVVGTFQGAALAGVMMTSVFVDAPATTSNVQYTLCSEADSEAAVGTMARIDFTLFEVNDAADLAEVYPTNDSTLQSGEVVTFDPELNTGISRSTKAYDRNAIGVVSTKPAMVIGGRDGEGVDGKPVALSGRVPVKVKGTVKKGDILTSSSIPGVAMKATKAGPILGIAMTDYDPTTASGQVGTVMLFVKTGYFNGVNLAEIIANPIQTSTNSSAIEDFGKTVLSYMIQEKINTNASSIEASEIVTDRVAAGLEVITPKVLAGEVATDTLVPATGTDLTVQLGPEGKFVLQSASPASQDGTIPETKTSVITFDVFGNAFFAGEVAAGSIRADKISGLEVITDRLFALSGTVDDLAAPGASVTVSQLSALNQQVQTLSGAADKAAAWIANGKTQLTALTNQADATKARLDALDPVFEDWQSRLVTLENQPALDLYDLNLDGGLTVSGLSILSGGLRVDQIGSIGDAIEFLSDAVFIGRPYFNADTAGFAVIGMGGTTVEVTFDEEYLEPPVVSATIALPAAEEGREYLNVETENLIFGNDLRYLVSNVSTEGFTIVMDKSMTVDVPFSWIALAVKDPKTFLSEPASGEDSYGPVFEPTPEPAFEPVPEPVIEPITESVTEPATFEAEPTPGPVPESTLEPAPEPTPEPVPEPAPEPVLEPTPEPASAEATTGEPIPESTYVEPAVSAAPAAQESPAAAAPVEPSV